METKKTPTKITTFEGYGLQKVIVTFDILDLYTLRDIVGDMEAYDISASTSEKIYDVKTYDDHKKMYKHCANKLLALAKNILAKVPACESNENLFVYREKNKVSE